MRWSSGDYQIAPKPPGGRLWLVAADAAGVWGTPPAGGTGEFYAAARLHLIRPLRGHLPLKGKANGGASSGGTCFPAGRSVRGSDKPPACHSIPRTPQVEGFFRPGALLLALFIAFWRCRSGPSGTGETGHRRGLCRGRRSWGPRWAAPRAGRSSSRRFGVFPPTWPADAGDASPAY